MKDSDDNSIDVNATDDVSKAESPDLDPSTSIPDQLRHMADTLENDPDTQLLLGVSAVDIRNLGESDERPVNYDFHLVNHELIDSLPFGKTLGVVKLFNETVLDNAMEVGRRDALEEVEKPEMNSVDVSDLLGGL